MAFDLSLPRLMVLATALAAALPPQVVSSCCCAAEENCCNDAETGNETGDQLCGRPESSALPACCRGCLAPKRVEAMSLGCRCCDAPAGCDCDGCACKVASPPPTIPAARPMTPEVDELAPARAQPVVDSLQPIGLGENAAIETAPPPPPTYPADIGAQPLLGVWTL